MSQRVILCATLGSAALLLGALAFQYLGGLAPCKMCIWQRWPHGIAIALGLLWLIRPVPALALVAGGIVAIGAGIGVYHAGVELQIFAGPDSCTAGPIEGVSADDLLEQILTAPVVRCDEIPWSLGGISMAGWNAILSGVLAGLWIVAWQRRAG